MGFARRAATALTTMVLAAAASPALGHGFALAPSGGAEAPTDAVTGGSEYGVRAAAALPERPVLDALSVPRTAPAGALPRVSLRLDEPGVETVYVEVSVTNLSTHRLALTAKLGWTHTGRLVLVRWPTHASLPAGSYVVSVGARDHRGRTLIHAAHSSGAASLTVLATPPPPTAAPPSSGAPEGTTSAPAGAPTPRQTVLAGAVFPVLGAHNFGGPENRFGAPREGHVHQGQDVLAAEGLPVVAPLPGTIASTSYQAAGAGYYAVENASDGLALMFAHCQAGSLRVSAGEPVLAGQTLCGVGQTGDATTPHLHLEVWIGGWQASGGYPIDPLPYLQAWEGAALAGG